MKKIKVLTSLVGLTGLSMGLVPMVASCNKSSEPKVEVSEDVTKLGVTIKSSNIVKDKDSTITFGLPTKKVLKSVKVSVGNEEVTDTDMSVESPTLTIKAKAMIDTQVMVKSVTLGDDEVKVTSIKITNDTPEVNQNDEIELTTTIAPETATNKELEWVVTPSTGAQVVTHDNKTYLKGLAAGTVSVVAKAKDGSGVTSAPVTFTVFEAIPIIDGAITLKATETTKLSWFKYNTSSWLQYSYSGEENAWTNVTPATQQTPSMTFGDSEHQILYLRGHLINDEWGTDQNQLWLQKNSDSDPASVVLGGSMMNLLQDTEGAAGTSLQKYAFSKLFQDSGAIQRIYETTTAKLLPTNNLNQECYTKMFEACINLINMPALPATSLGNSCYYEMFNECSSLTSIHDLPASILNVRSYEGMFRSCTSLKKAPKISCTTLDELSCSMMFFNCSNLKINNDKTGTKFFTCPSTIPNDAVERMFANTGGSFQGNPVANGEYYYSVD